MHLIAWHTAEVLCSTNDFAPWHLSTPNQANWLCQVISQETKSLGMKVGLEHTFSALGHQHKLHNLHIHISSPLRKRDCSPSCDRRCLEQQDYLMGADGSAIRKIVTLWEHKALCNAQKGRSSSALLKINCENWLVQLQKEQWCIIAALSFSLQTCRVLKGFLLHYCSTIWTFT